MQQRHLEWATSFWIGIGLMSAIDIWKITQAQNALSYSWIMLGFSIIFLVICTILLIKRKKKK
jgi:tellurite resistance protein TehA-like permease